jgi:hypothetical protein
LATLADAVPLKRWQKIVARAIKDAEQGDAKARRWLGEYLLGRQPGGLMALAAAELAGTLDGEIQARAAGLRVNLIRKRVMNRVSSYPDLSPGQPSGSGDIGKASPDPHTDPKAQAARNGHPG